MNSTKQSVVDTYGKLAKAAKGTLFSKLFVCCDTQATVKAIGQKIGYSKTELDTVPEGANLGIGCGNPSALANIKAGETVIDLGSGAGFDAFLIARQVGPTGQVIGVDLSDEMLQLARRNAKKGKYANVKFVKGDIEDLVLEDNIADHVISNCVINLSLNKGAVYQEAYRILKPGGMLSISDIILVKELPDFIKNALAGHIACIAGAEPLEDYLGYIKAAGFKAITIQSQTAFPLELTLTDPQIQKIAQKMQFDLNSAEARDLASRVVSISLTAHK